MARALALVAIAAAPAVAAPPLGDPSALRARSASQEERLLSRVPALDDPLLAAHLAAIAARLLPSSPPPELPPLRIVVLLDASRSAFSLPHGGIYVSTGALARLRGEDQLAMLLAREISHLRRHRAGRAATTPLPAEAPPHLFRALGLDLAYAAAVIGFGAEAEREADTDALALLAAAGFDLDAAPGAFDELRRGLRDEGGREGFLLGDVRHLDDRRTRFAALRLDRVAAAPAAREESDQVLEQALRVALRENARREGQVGRFPAARGQLARALRAAPGDPVAHVYAGDLDRLQAQRRRSPAERQPLRDEARIAYERAALLAPTYPEPHQRLGLLFYEVGDLDAARDAFNRYLALSPDGPEARRVREYLAALSGERAQR